MRILTKKQFLEMPEGTIFQKVIPNCSNGPMGMKLKNCGEDDFWMIELDLVSLLGCSFEQNEAFLLGFGDVDMGQERDGTHDDNERFLCMYQSEKDDLLEALK